MHYDFCQTLGELDGKLDARTETRPAFTFTLPQNLHISNRQHGAVPPGESYPGFSSHTRPKCIASIDASASSCRT